MHEIKHGVEPTKLDKRDYSYLRSFGATAPAALPTTYDLDAGFYMPNQNLYNDFFGFPAMPYGCTEYTCNELCSDEDKIPYNPFFTESKIHANAKGGIDMRTPLASVCSDGVLQKGLPVDPSADKIAQKNKRAAYFRVGQNPDYFDGARTVIFANKRPVSVGTPFFNEWGNKAWTAGNDGILPMPNISNVAGLNWHCYKISGWVVINGITYLKCKMWAGPSFGDNGWTYMSREVFNAVMTIVGTGAFTVAQAIPAQIQTVGSVYVFQHNLNYGITNIEVAELQKALQSLGYTIINATTTYFGVETKAALARFQKDYGIIDDGSNFGPLTRYAMNKVLNPSQSLFGAVQLFIQTFFGL